MGILYMMIASLLYGVAPSIQKFLLLRGNTPVALVVICNSFAAFFALLFCLIRKESLRISPKQLLQTALAGGIGMGITEVVLNASYAFLPVGFATMIHFMFPSIVCLVMAVFFRERLTPLKLGAILFSICGLILLTGGGSGGALPGVLLALLSSLTYSFYLIANERWSIRDLPQMALSFYVNLFTVAVNLIVSLFTPNIYPSAGSDWLLCALIGAMFCCAVAAIGLGVARLGAGSGSFFGMMEPIISLVVSALAFHYAITRLNALGCLLILASMLLVALHDRRQEKVPV
jgi:drug/metabolite transporter (DMT)-like permease